MWPARTLVAIVLGVVLAGAALLLMFSRHEAVPETPGAQPTVALERILPEGAPAPIGPYSPAIRAGGLLFLSGQIGLDPLTGQMVEGGIVPETRQALANLRTLLSAAGLGFDNVARATVYLADMDDYTVFNGEYASVFGEVPPARVAVEVARLPLDARVEISMIAVGAGG